MTDESTGGVYSSRSVVGARRLRSALTVFGLIIRVPAEAGSTDLAAAACT
ncbi:MAG: hypothetical protein M3325_05965 [Actinomycetota bacterium]|nr:hypothetical protein [Actinomycetota bacterium]